MHKILKYLLVGAVSLGTLGFSSCNKFLDVQPKGTLTEDAQFSTINGYNDAVFGLYATMAGTSLYGGPMTFNFVDKLGQLFYNRNGGDDDTDLQIGSFSYTNARVRTMTDNLWASLYRTISYANNILRNAEDAQFSDSRLARIQAEAYGTRALLHLDVYRLFGPMDYEAHKSERLLPYSATFNLETKPVYTNEEFLNLILADLQRAEDLMGDDETISVDPAPTNADFTANRAVHLNKYAVYALFARVYNLMGDSAKAQEYAEKVIGKFTLAQPTRFASVQSFPAPGEMVFGLYTSSFRMSALGLFGAGNTFGRYDIQTIYGVSTATAGNRDERYAAFYVDEGGFGAATQDRFIRFGRSRTVIDAMAQNTRGLTMLRLPEMYYIQAEALYRQGQTEAALSALNAVRSSRGLQPLTSSTVTTLDQLKEQILLEFIKEYPGEGQVFFAMKHLAIPFTSYNNAAVQPSEAIFVLPRPVNEQTYGRS